MGAKSRKQRANNPYPAPYCLPTIPAVFSPLRPDAGLMNSLYPKSKVPAKEVRMETMESYHFG
jgi:hypothetical protein